MEFATPTLPPPPMTCALSDDASLLETSNLLFCQGREKEALHLLEESTLTENAPDLYLEEEGDVGPRAFRLPSLSRQSLETSIAYNKAIIHHARSEYLEAIRTYEQVVMITTPAVVTAADATSCNDVTILKMRAHNNLGQIFYMAGISEAKALEHFTHALGIAKTLGSQHSLDLATVLSNWCRVQWMSGDVSQMVYEGLHEILRLRLSVLGWDHPDVASAHYNLGVTEYAHNDGSKAVGHLMKYLQVVATQAARTNARMTPDLTLDPIPALIYILLVKNEDKEDSLAQELVRGLRTLQEKRADAIVGQQPTEIASVLNFIGTLLFHQRDFDHALLFFQEELRLEEDIVAACKMANRLGTEDISVSVTCNNIARILQEMQRLPEAKVYYFRSLMADYGSDIQSWSLDSKKGMDTPSLNYVVPLKSGRQINDLPASTVNLYSTVWYNLGLIHDKQGSYKEAIHAFQMSLSLRRVMLGPDHADVACLLYNIGVLQMEQQFLKEATLSLREALRIRRAAPSDTPSGQLNDGHVVKTLQKLSSLHKARGNIRGALEAQKEVFQIQSSTREFDCPALRQKEMAATTREMAELYHAQGDLVQAVARADDGVALMRQVQVSSEHDLTKYVACMEELVAGLLLVGSLKHEICQPDEARAHYSEASTMIQQASNCFSHATELNALQEVTTMLATCHCAPEA